MKHILALFLLTILTLSFRGYASSTTDESAHTFHERLVERDLQIYSGAIFSTISPAPSEISEIQARALDELIGFATSLDLFALGFSYDLDGRTYQIIKDENIIGYTFSIIISKDDQPKTRRFYKLSERVDGVFYVDHIANYDF